MQVLLLEILDENKQDAEQLQEKMQLQMQSTQWEEIIATMEE